MYPVWFLKISGLLFTQLILNQADIFSEFEFQTYEEFQSKLKKYFGHMYDIWKANLQENTVFMLKAFNELFTAIQKTPNFFAQTNNALVKSKNFKSMGMTKS